MSLFAKIDCGLPRDPRMLAAGPHARLIYIEIVLYCRENLTDGHLDKLQLPLIAVDVPAKAKHITRLVELGALDQTDTGWAVPLDVWRKWNPLRTEVDEQRAHKAEASALGNHKRWHSADEPSPKCDHCREAGWIGRRSQTRSQVGSQTGSQTRSQGRQRWESTEPEGEREREPEGESEPEGATPRSTDTPPSRTVRSSRRNTRTEPTPITHTLTKAIGQGGRR